MFVLAHIKDVARVMPSHFSEARLKRIELEINKKYANKVSAYSMCVEWLRLGNTHQDWYMLNGCILSCVRSHAVPQRYRNCWLGVLGHSRRWPLHSLARSPRSRGLNDLPRGWRGTSPCVVSDGEQWTCLCIPATRQMLNVCSTRHSRALYILPHISTEWPLMPIVSPACIAGCVSPTVWRNFTRTDSKLL